MVVLRRRQVACVRALAVVTVLAGFMFFVYFYMEGNDELQRKMELVIKDINDDTDKALHAIEELEGHLEELDIQPMPEAQYVVYNRVPKCASMSMTTLSYKLGSRNNFKVESPYEAGERPDKSRSEQIEFVDYLKNQEPPYMYIRHQYYIDFSDLNENVPAAYINMIRDPIARFESFYYFSRFGNKKGGGGNARMSEEVRSETVDECVAKRRKECTQPVWQVVPYLCGMARECMTRSREAVQIAMDNVEENYLFVGVLEEMPKSLRILETLLPHFFSGASELSEAEAAKDMRDQTLTLNKKPASEETRRFLREETSLALEYQLYDFVLEHLHKIAKKLDIPQ